MKKQAIKVIKSNIYLTLATTDGITPWASAVYYCVDEDYNFYFISKPDALHSLNIKIRPKVGFAIFDSRQAEGTGCGVQGTGIVELLEGEEVINGIKHYKTTFITLTPGILTGENSYRLFKIHVEKWFMQDPETDEDKRIEVSLA